MCPDNPNPFTSAWLETETIVAVIPMFRVAAHIQSVIQSIPRWVSKIVVVNDASPDNCEEKVRSLQDERVVMISHPINKGVGGAMISGFQKALEFGASIVVKIDGDGQMPVEYLEPLVAPIIFGETDFAKGNRFAIWKSITAMPKVRRWGNLSLSFITKAASGYWNVFDPTNGFIAIDAEMLTRIDLGNLHTRYFFESSLLCELNRFHAVITDVSMPARYGEATSSLSIKQTLLEFPALLLKAWLRRIFRNYFIYDFSIGSLYLVVGFILTTFGTLWGAGWWIHSVVTNKVTTTGTVMIAVLPIMIGIQLLLQFSAYDIQNVPRVPLNRRGRASKITNPCSAN